MNSYGNLFPFFLALHTFPRRRGRDIKSRKGFLVNTFVLLLLRENSLLYFSSIFLHIFCPISLSIFRRRKKSYLALILFSTIFFFSFSLFLFFTFSSSSILKSNKVIYTKMRAICKVHNRRKPLHVKEKNYIGL